MGNDSRATRVKETLLGFGILALGLAGLLYFAFRNDRRLVEHGLRTTGVVKARFQIVKQGSKPVPIAAMDQDGQQYSLDLTAKGGEIEVEFQDQAGETHSARLRTGALGVIGYREGGKVAIVYLREDPSVVELAKTVEKGHAASATKMVYVCLGVAGLLLAVGTLLPSGKPQGVGR